VIKILAYPFVLIRNLFLMYYHGFRENRTARMLLLIVAIKLVVMFVVLKIFFFRDFLGSRFETDQEKSEYVLDRLTGKH
jgi:Na+/H+ antiporter NhaD/arsenite permease-like protein